MLFAIPEELELQGVPYKEASQIAFQNKYFIRALDFPKNARKVAVQFCKLNSDLLCLLVESQHYLTVWLEQKEASSEIKKESSLTKNTIHASPKPVLIPEPSVPEIRKHRSFIYEQIAQHHNHSSKGEPSQLPTKNPTLSEDAVPAQNIFENLTLPQDENSLHDVSSSNLSPNPQPPTKKRLQRRYRGISY